MVVAALFAAASAPAPAPFPPGHDLPIVEANDNRTPAGVLTDGVLTLRLVVTMARWYPNQPGGPHTEVPVFAEEGKAPQVPGPLIRVPVGTELRVTVRNALPDSTIALLGFQSRPAAGADSLAIAPGQARELTFRADQAGTFLYAATVGVITGETEQLAGAMIVDPPGGRTDDRIWVINIWSKRTDSSSRQALTINGKSWPHSERITATVGDSVRWRVLNGSERNHPMHLHGFYYSVLSRGDGLVDTSYAAEQRRMVVTETLFGRNTMTMTWVPEQVGNWLFHCHLSFHVIPEAQLDPPADGHHALLSGDLGEHMAGLVMGISVAPRPGQLPIPWVNPRKVSVWIREGPPPGAAPRAMSFVVSGDGREPPAGRFQVPGEPLILTQGRPTDVTVHNSLPEATSIHWHGLELESWSDGVPGWSGGGNRVAAPIQPGDSLTVHLTLKRAGTFIYHTHLNDIEQVTSGLYGPLIVLPPGEVFDSVRDLLFVGGWDGVERSQGLNPMVVNGVHEEPPLELSRGASYRLRFINIAPAGNFRFRITRNGELVEWRMLAKDGADLPAHRAVQGPAAFRIFAGETFDVEFTPTEPGDYLLSAPSGPTTAFYQRVLTVR